MKTEPARAAIIGLAIILSEIAAFSQPPAPIEWGEPRWANLAGWPGLPVMITLRVIPMGDTLLFTARNEGSPVSDTILVCSSFDNGQTFTPWIPISDGSNSVAAFFTGSAGHFYAFFNEGTMPPDETWLRVSADGGLTWGTPQQYRTNTYVLRGFAVGNEVLAVFRNSLNNNLSTQVTRSTDFGHTWTAPVVVDTADFYLVYCGQSIAFTSTHRLLIEEPVPSRWDPRYYVALGDNTGQNWAPFEPLACDYYDPWGSRNKAAIIGDTASEAAGILGILGLGGSSFDRPFHWRTSEVGSGWQGCVALTEEPHVIPWWSTDVPLNICCGKLWLVGWEHDDPQGWNFLGTRFSANHAKNWYPLQVAADSLAQADFFSGQIRGNQIDLYWTQGCCGQALPWDYCMVTGTITPDTTFPELAPGTAPPETVRVGQHLQFTVTVTDNDTLSDVRLLIAKLWGDTLGFGMAHGENNSYHFAWTVPDSGYYNYWFEGEDWWENVGVLPDSGSFRFVTEGWSSSADRILPPSSFTLSVFPNPCNTWPSLALSPDWFAQGPAELTVHNTLGREVIRKTITEPAAQLSLDVPAASGVYLLQVTCRRYSAQRKFVVLK